MMELGAIGSPIDAATFVALLVLLRYEYSNDLRKVAAAVVALAEDADRVDHDRLRSALEVDDAEVEELRPTIIYEDGGNDE